MLKNRDKYGDDAATSSIDVPKISALAGHELSKSNLTDADYRDLAKRYITKEIADAAGIHRVSHDEGWPLVTSRPNKGSDYAGLVIPYLEPGGTRQRQLLRLRRDNPDIEKDSDGNEKLTKKYLTAPGMFGRSAFYFPPSVNPAWLDDVAVPVTVTEGEFKGLALQRFFDERNEKRMVIAIPGVWNWKGVNGKAKNAKGKSQVTKGAINDFSKVKWEKRQVEVIFDADVETNSSVSSARREMANELKKRKAIIRLLDMPSASSTGAKGIDDLLYLKSDTPGFVSKWIDEARTTALPMGMRVKVQGVTFELRDEGVFAIEDMGGNVTQPVFVCSPLFIIADTCDEDSRNWGRLLSFQNRRGEWCQWAMPMSLLKGDGQEYRGELLDQGVTFGGRKAREYLGAYLNKKPDRQATSVSRMGWHRGAFILPEQVYGAPDGEDIYLQSLQRNWLIRQSGTLNDWQSNIAAFCAGNTRLAFAVSVSFAAPLLGLVDGESGGFHYRGSSSLGKSTAQFVAGSVWGGGEKGFLLRWRATANGLEAVAEMHNDGLLCLDELAELDPREAGEVAYMLANGQGKLRMQKVIALRRPIEWRLLYLSSGELSLADHVEKAGKSLRGGQEVRLVDIEADAGKGAGLFENLHTFKNGDAFSRHLRTESARYYGTAIHEFLARLITEQEAIRSEYRVFSEAFRKDNLTDDASSEASRVCNRFALVAFAGKLASEYGITGWTEPEAENAASVLFADWLSRKGKGRTDEETIIRHIRKYIEQYGDSRFRLVGKNVNDGRTINNRAGYLEKDENGVAVYFFNRETFKTDVCNGFDSKQVINALKARDWLLFNHGNQYKRHDPESGQTVPFFAVSSEILAG